MESINRRRHEVKATDEEAWAVLASLERRAVAEREMQRRQRAADEAETIRRMGEGWRW
jgi:hypothetical protein